MIPTPGERVTDPDYGSGTVKWIDLLDLPKVHAYVDFDSGKSEWLWWDLREPRDRAALRAAVRENGKS